jgi:hypothetical protein
MRAGSRQVLDRPPGRRCERHDMIPDPLRLEEPPGVLQQNPRLSISEAIVAIRGDAVLKHDPMSISQDVIRGRSGLHHARSSTAGS